MSPTLIFSVVETRGGASCHRSPLAFQESQTRCREDEGRGEKSENPRRQEQRLQEELRLNPAQAEPE